MDFDYDNVFDDIIYSDEPSNVSTISTLRHYINVHGITKKLKEYFNVTHEQICEICEHCRGKLYLKDVIKNYDEVINESIESENKHIEAIHKNNELVEYFRKRQHDYCGVGYRKVKLRLNKEIKLGDKEAKAYRLVLEIEDKNIRAKEANPYYGEKIYNQKHKLIEELIDVCKENSYVYGIQGSDISKTSSIIYFDLPNCEQISFHCDITDAPNYTKEWDGKVNSTLDKIEKTLLSRYKF